MTGPEQQPLNRSHINILPSKINDTNETPGLPILNLQHLGNTGKAYEQLQCYNIGKGSWSIIATSLAHVTPSPHSLQNEKGVVCQIYTIFTKIQTENGTGFQKSQFMMANGCLHIWKFWLSYPEKWTGICVARKNVPGRQVVILCITPPFSRAFLVDSCDTGTLLWIKSTVSVPILLGLLCWKRP